MTAEAGWARRGVKEPRIFSLSPAIPHPLLHPAQSPDPVTRTAAAQGGPEFQDIVGRTDERPFAAHLLHPAQQELSIAAALLDLTEDRLDNCFATRIEPATVHRAECAAHPVRHRQSCWQSASGRSGYRLAIELAIRRDEGATAQRRKSHDVRFTEIPRIHTHTPRDLTSLGQHLGQHRLGLLLVTGFIGDIGRDNDLGPCINSRLAVVLLHATPLGIRGWHDPALGIREVALGLRRRARSWEAAAVDLGVGRPSGVPRGPPV